MRASTLAAAGLLMTLLAPSVRASDPGLWRNAFGWGSDPLRDKYEELFDSKYPAHGYDPFNRSFPFEDVHNFNRAFDQRAAGVSRLVERTDTQVVMTVNWPGSGGQAIDVDVRRSVVRLAPSRGEEATGQYRFRAAMAHELEFDVPNDAVGKTAQVTREGDRIRIAFARRSLDIRRIRSLWSGGLLYPGPDIQGGTGAPVE